MTGLVEYFNKQPKLGVTSTSSKDGKVDSVICGSPRMIDEKTAIVALGGGRTFANLQENPNAVFMVMEPRAGIFHWKGTGSISE
ncbi:MAG: pyridoxamine 5'-phosphate oxidase family protein [Methanotrichaceae archaeon]|nr:pyridoxamine 5'-phosphate oxidase family protein [Methanotrichaceae archaeon]